MQRFDIDIYQGATFRLNATWVDPDGDPIDMTGYLARMQIRQTYDASAPLISLTESSGIALGGVDGVVAVEISAAQTASLPVSRNSGIPPMEQFYYDLEVEAPDGTVTRMLFGAARVYREVTR